MTPNKKLPRKPAMIAGAIALAGSAAVGTLVAQTPEKGPENTPTTERLQTSTTTSTTTAPEYVQIGAQELENGVLEQQMNPPVLDTTTTSAYRGEPGTKPNADPEAWKQALEDAQIGTAAVQLPGEQPQVRQG